MDRERNRLIQQLCQSAQRWSPDQRDVLLRQACAGDDSLREDVEALLAHAREHSAETGPATTALTEASPAAQGAMTGLILNRYLLEGKIGEGGMGVVFKARDTHLGRPVAIKTVREGSQRDEEALEHLRKEAMAVASIDHPYICKIYELLEFEGQLLIVMEFVDGEALADIVSRSTLDIPKTLGFALEIAEALGAAHARGLIHRDIKPSNVMITKDSHVKILDFGLALSRAEEATADTDSLPAGHVAGTVSYMAPEQAARRTVDRRCDVFSFGALIFQCLTGHLPFETPDQPYVVSLMTKEPASLRNWLPGVPRELETLVSKCLEKKPSKRFDSAVDLIEPLKHVAKVIGRASGNSARQVRTGRAIRLSLSIAAAVIVLIAVWVWIYGPMRQRQTASKVPRSLMPLITWPSEESNSRISPDGNWISFISNHDGYDNIWLRNLTGSEPIQITKHTTGIASHLWSPKGDEIAYILRQGSRDFLQVVPAFFGGSPRLSYPMDRPLASLVRWFDSGIYIETPGSLWRLDLTTGNWTHMASIQNLGLRSIREFDVSPDEKRIVFSARSGEAEDIWMADLNGSHKVPLTADAFSDRRPRWLGRQGTAVVYQSNRSGQTNIWQTSVADKSARQITFSSDAESPEDTSRDGSILSFEQTKENSNLWSLNPRTGLSHPLTADALNDFWPSFSPQGAVLAFQRSKPALQIGYQVFESQIMVGEWSRAGFQNVRTLVKDGYRARLSADGKWLAYLTWPARPDNLMELWITDISYQRVARVSDRCVMSGYYQFPLDWIAVDFDWNAGSLYFVALSSSGRQEVLKMDPESDPLRSELVVPAAGDRNSIRDLRFSNDGRRLSYVVRSTNSWQVHNRDLTSGDDKLAFSDTTGSAGGVLSRGWLDDGTMIMLRYTRNPDTADRVEVIEISPSGERRLVATAAHAFGATARLSPTGHTLYLTEIDGIVHNLYELSLTTRTSRRLTDNELPGVTFSGLEIAGEETIVFSRHVRNSDIWLIRFDR